MNDIVCEGIDPQKYLEEKIASLEAEKIRFQKNISHVSSKTEKSYIRLIRVIDDEIRLLKSHQIIFAEFPEL